jgi:hypothetical protein
VVGYPRSIVTGRKSSTRKPEKAASTLRTPLGIRLTMTLRSPEADVCRMRESIAQLDTPDTRNKRDKRPHAHAAWTEHFP